MPPLAPQVPGASCARAAAALAKRTVESINFGGDDFIDGWKNSITAVEEASNISRLKAALEFVTAYETPRQILLSLPKLRGAVPGRLSDHNFFNFSWLTLRFVYRRLLNNLEHEIKSIQSYDLWQRTAYSDTVQLYSADPEEGRDKTLIVGYTGNFLRLMMPTYRFLSALDPAKFDFILLRDPEKRLFINGLSGIGADPLAVSDYISEIAKKRKSKQVIAIGTSGGAFAALIGALHNRWRVAICVSAPCLRIWIIKRY